MQNQQDTETFRARLVAKKEEIQKLRDMSKDARDAVELDQTTVGRLSRMDAMQGQAMAQATERSRQADLVRIESALKRLDDGSFGRCVVCDDDIAPKRLEFDPAVPTCISCATPS